MLRLVCPVSVCVIVLVVLSRFVGVFVCMALLEGFMGASCDCPGCDFYEASFVAE